jgi:FeS assembly SUF system protein
MMPMGAGPVDSPANELSQSIDDIVPDPGRIAEIRPQVIEALKTVYDPEIPVNIYEMGLIYDVIVDARSRVGVRMTLTAPACPAAQTLPVEVKQKAAAVAGVSEAKVEIVWDPPWTKDRMSDVAKLELGML